MRQLGSIIAGSTFDFKFSTYDTDGAPITLAGTPAISVYKDNSTTQTTTGVTLTTDFDSVTGLHNVRIVTTDSFYAGGSNFQVVITTGTVDSISVVGTVLAEFSIDASYHSGTAQAGAASSITLSASASATDDFYNGSYVSLAGGTGSGGQSPRIISDYNGTTKVASIFPNWATNPDSTSIYVVAPLASLVDVRGINGTAVTGAGTSGDKWRAA